MITHDVIIASALQLTSPAHPINQLAQREARLNDTCRSLPVDHLTWAQLPLSVIQSMWAERCGGNFRSPPTPFSVTPLTRPPTPASPYFSSPAPLTCSGQWCCQELRGQLCLTITSCTVAVSKFMDHVIIHNGLFAECEVLGQFSRTLWSKDEDLWFKDKDKDLRSENKNKNL